MFAASGISSQKTSIITEVKDSQRVREIVQVGQRRPEHDMGTLHLAAILLDGTPFSSSLSIGRSPEIRQCPEREGDPCKPLTRRIADCAVRNDRAMWGAATGEVLLL
jgi:hypothetical protein